MICHLVDLNFRMQSYVLTFLLVETWFLLIQVAYLKEFGLSNEDVGRLLAFKPHLMGCGIEEKFKPLVKYFYYLGISKDGMRKILVTRPVLFCVDFETTIVPKVCYYFWHVWSYIRCRSIEIRILKSQFMRQLKSFHFWLEISIDNSHFCSAFYSSKSENIYYSFCLF